MTEVTEQPAEAMVSQPQNGGYYQPPVQQAGKPQEEMTLGNWMVTLLLTMIPCVNLIMLFVWGFGGGTPSSKANWAKANLIYMLIVVVIYIVIFAVWGAAIGAMFYNFS